MRSWDRERDLLHSPCLRCDGPSYFTLCEDCAANMSVDEVLAVCGPVNVDADGREVPSE